MFVPCYLLPWLGPPLMAVQCIYTSSFLDDVMLSHIESMTTLMFRPFHQVAAPVGRQTTLFGRVCRVVAPGVKVYHFQLHPVGASVFFRLVALVLPPNQDCQKAVKRAARRNKLRRRVKNLLLKCFCICFNVYWWNVAYLHRQRATLWQYHNEIKPHAYVVADYWQDFGDYADSYYAVQTTEGEQIAQLISGYIDIILKKVCRLNIQRPTCLSNLTIGECSMLLLVT